MLLSAVGFAVSATPVAAGDMGAAALLAASLAPKFPPQNDGDDPNRNMHNTEKQLKQETQEKRDRIADSSPGEADDHAPKNAKVTRDSFL